MTKPCMYERPEAISLWEFENVTCPFCKMIFSHDEKIIFDLHVQDHFISQHKEDNCHHAMKRDKWQAVENNQKQLFKCWACSKTFFFLNNLFVHLQDHIQCCPFGCHICGRAFESKQKLETHSMIHLIDVIKLLPNHDFELFKMFGTNIPEKTPNDKYLDGNSTANPSTSSHENSEKYFIDKTDDSFKPCLPFEPIKEHNLKMSLVKNDAKSNDPSPCPSKGLELQYQTVFNSKVTLAKSLKTTSPSSCPTEEFEQYSKSVPGNIPPCQSYSTKTEEDEHAKSDQFGSVVASVPWVNFPTLAITQPLDLSQKQMYQGNQASTAHLPVDSDSSVGCQMPYPSLSQQGHHMDPSARSKSKDHYFKHIVHKGSRKYPPFLNETYSNSGAAVNFLPSYKVNKSLGMEMIPRPRRFHPMPFHQDVYHQHAFTFSNSTVQASTVNKNANCNNQFRT